MKRRVLVTTVALVFGVLAVVPPVAAQNAGDVLTDQHIQMIRQNCGEALRALQQVHTSDAPTRINRGQTYELISSKLMAPFNSRLVLNKLDASSLIKTTTQYDKSLTDFRDHYRLYDDQVAATLTIDCTKQPVAFYDSISKARALRDSVHTDVMKLQGLIAEYQKTLEAVRPQLKNPAQSSGDTQ